MCLPVSTVSAAAAAADDDATIEEVGMHSALPSNMSVTYQYATESGMET